MWYLLIVLPFALAGLCAIAAALLAGRCDQAREQHLPHSEAATTAAVSTQSTTVSSY